MPRIPERAELRSTTILGCVAGGMAALGGDGQVSFGETILKSTANKVRRLGHGEVLAGFAGPAADALQLFERFEEKLDAHRDDLRRTAVELAREWRSDRVWRKLPSQLAVVSCSQALLISGSGDVIEPDDGMVAIGSGGAYALAACRALRRHSGLSVAQCVEEALRVASEICVYTGGSLTVLSLPS